MDSPSSSIVFVPQYGRNGGTGFALTPKRENLQVDLVPVDDRSGTEESHAESRPTGGHRAKQGVSRIGENARFRQIFSVRGSLFVFLLHFYIALLLFGYSCLTSRLSFRKILLPIYSHSLLHSNSRCHLPSFRTLDIADHTLYG